tara:strand:- start:3098 stop:3409 length:312 start_codon:yes stop_codon:yes gene_type:complete
MSRTTNIEVVKAWSNSSTWGQGILRSHTDNLRTDGRNLFSYGLRIGVTLGGQKIAIDYTAPANSFRSMTTSNHVGKAKRYADVSMHPKVAAMTIENSTEPFRS